MRCPSPDQPAGGGKLQQEIRQQQELLRLLRPYLPHGTVINDRENREDVQRSEDADSNDDQEESSSDNASDGSFQE